MTTQLFTISQSIMLTLSEQIEQRIRYLSIGFCLLFIGFNASQGLQSLVHHHQGYLNLGVLYFTFSIGCLFSPILLRKYTEVNGTDFILPTIIYIVVIVLNAYDLPEWVMTLSNALNGLAAAILWVMQGAFLTRNAVLSARYKRDEGEEQNMVGESGVVKETSAFNSIFFSFFQFSGCIGTFLSAIIILASHQNLTQVRTQLFIILAVIAGVAMPVFWMIIPSPAPESSDEGDILRREGNEDGDDGPMSILRVGMMEPRLYYVLPAAFGNGCLLSFVFGDLPERGVAPILGPGFASFALAVFYGVNSLVTVVWGRMVVDMGRRQCFRNAIMLQTVGMVLLISVVLVSNWWQLDGETTVYDLFVLFPRNLLLMCSVLMIAMGDAAFEAFIPAVLQTYFPKSRESVVANSLNKFAQSVGFSFMFLLDVFFSTMSLDASWVLIMRGLLVIFITTSTYKVLLIADQLFPFTTRDVNLRPGSSPDDA